MRVAGIMSGTSLDGIDVAVIDIHNSRIATVTHRSTSYPASIRKAILAASTPAEISQLNFQLGELFAQAVQKVGVPLETIELIGCHGQTIYHQGQKPVNTLQIGEAAVIAERTGITVVNDFRVRDIAAGGQGAPLVPFVDYLLFRHPKRTRVALNIGGIANITRIPARATPEDIIAFDTGPGNMVMDALVSELTNEKQLFDRNGAIAAKGQINRKLLDDLLTDSYYRQQPPKSAGREQYGAEFVARLSATNLPLQDLIATANAFTAATIAIGIRMAGGADEIIASGGGVHNRQLMANLAALIPNSTISTATEHGIDADAKEAIAFAILAYQTIRHRPGNLPTATGARRAVVLGKITPAC
jgi:anhydro-N-acetylmuramic acid kinase